jgi:hypothetical protein
MKVASPGDVVHSPVTPEEFLARRLGDIPTFLFDPSPKKAREEREDEDDSRPPGGIAAAVARRYPDYHLMETTLPSPRKSTCIADTVMEGTLVLVKREITVTYQ